MITELRRLAIELRQEAEELTEGQDPEVNWDAEDELNDALADARREIAARIELVLKRGMLDTAERLEESGGLEWLRLTEVGVFAHADKDAVFLRAYGVNTPEPWATLDLDSARQLRDFLIAALLPHEHDTGL